MVRGGRQGGGKKSFGSGSKPVGKRGAGAGGSGGSRKKFADEAPFGLDDIDAFHKQRDTAKLNVSDDNGDSDADSELEAAAYELERGSGSEDDSSEEDDEEEDFSEEEEDADAALQAAIRRGGRIGKRACGPAGCMRCTWPAALHDGNRNGWRRLCTTRRPSPCGVLLNGSCLS